eukprot:6368739-Alexandrium_andersonii.AAC.1
MTPARAGCALARGGCLSLGTSGSPEAGHTADSSASMVAEYTAHAPRACRLAGWCSRNMRRA